jgi:hypothetical protein
MANKFISNLTQAGQQIKEQRAQLIAEDAEAAQSKLLETLKDEERSLKRKLMTLSDIYPDSELSLLVTKDKFDATQWAKDMQDVKISLLNKQVEIKAAQLTYDEWFKEQSTEA